MSPELLLSLLLAAANAESTATLPEVSTGLNFTVAFPENIAYYYPVRPLMKVQITALYDNTEVTIKQNSYCTTRPTLNKGDSKEYILDARMELSKTNVSNNTLQITSNNSITVQAINLKDSSLQTALFVPTDKLSTEYLIPPVPAIQGTTFPADIVTTEVTERSPFKLVIVNADTENMVTVEGAVSNQVSLQPYQVAQIWVKSEDNLRKVKAEHSVAVLFGHTCAFHDNCTCGQLFAMLPPAQDETLKFYIPPVLGKNADNKTFVLLSNENFTKVEAFNPNLTLVETAGSAIFYRPGLLISLIPETDFATCYVVNTISDAQSFAVILVNKDLKDGVRVGNLPLQNPDWQGLKGTDYVSTSVVLASGKSVIWHKSSKMAVYFMGMKENAWFGNPAPIISNVPDFRGCVLSPEVIMIGEVANGWLESLQYCRENNLELVSFPEAMLQTQIYEKVLQANTDNLQEAWFGMRRSSLSGEWYWLNGAPVNNTNWEKGEPGTVNDGQCAIMSLEEKNNFGWRDEDCCKAAHPICYKEPVFLPF